VFVLLLKHQQWPIFTIWKVYSCFLLMMWRSLTNIPLLKKHPFQSWFSFYVFICKYENETIQRRTVSRHVTCIFPATVDIDLHGCHLWYVLIYYKIVDIWNVLAHMFSFLLDLICLGTIMFKIIHVGRCRLFWALIVIFNWNIFHS
jgi:hypothetical protein